MIFYTDKVMKNVPQDVTVVAATKYFTPDEMRQLYHTGIHHFGENRVEGLLEKQEALKDLDITWHLIGTLQTKKAKKIIDKIDFLHSLDTIKLAEEINKRRSSPLKCFVQVNISNEDSKHGLNETDVIAFIKAVSDFENITIIGLMGMAEFTQDQSIIDEEFSRINSIMRTINKELHMTLKELSIGMSNDYLQALKHNASYLRLGSVLFRRDE
jgi:pyridoxal phosphate enzyme (YggS family)